MARTLTRARKPSLIEAILREAFSSGKPERVDRTAGVIYGVKVVGRKSPNTHGVRGVEGTDYTLEALRAAQHLYEGLNVNVDHPDRQNPGKDRSARDRFAWIEKTTVTEDGIFGNLHFLDPTDPLAVRMLNAAEKKPDAFGLSHNAFGKGKVQGNRYVITEIPEVRSVDIVADAGSTNSLFESREQPMKKQTLLEALTGLKINKDQLTALWEMDGMTPDMPADVPPEAEAEETYETHLGRTIVAIVNDESLTPEVKKKKVLQAVKLLGEEEEAAAAPVEESDDDESDDEKETKESRDLRAKLAKLERKDAVRTLCEAEKFQPSTIQLKALLGLDTDQERKAFILESKGQVPSKGKTAPRSGGAARLTESRAAAPKTYDDFKAVALKS